MAMIIRDPVDGVVRLIDEQVTKNAIDVNNLKVSDSVLATRISALEAGANLGGANLVRFSFTTDGNNYYQLMDDFELVTLPADWQNGDYIEVHSSFKNDIPAYGYIDGTMLVLEYMGDFITQYDTLVATNTTRGTSIELSISRYVTFLGSRLVEIDADNAKSQIVTILNDLSRNLSTQYVSFDLNNDGDWSWVYIGPIGTDGKDGFNILPFSTVIQYNEILANAKAGDTLLDGAGVVFNRGDLKTIVTVQPTVTFSDTGNILGPQGEQGPQGLVGPTTLMAIQAITGITDIDQITTIALDDTQLNREAKLGEYLTFIYINETTNNSFMVNAIVTTVGTTDIIATVLQAIKITGVQGPQGTAGPAGQSLNIQDGIYIPTTVPVFNTTEEGDAYIVLDTSGQLNTYLLYIHGIGGTDYTIVDNWNGVAGPAPTLTFTSTSIGSGGNSYATVTQTGPGAYTVNLFLASGLNASSVLDNNAGTSITRGYTQATVNQLLRGDNLLINPDFEINQRGQTSYTGANTYTVDRWQHGTSFVTANVLSKGVRLTASTSGTTGANYFLFNQTIEDYKKYAGKTVTATVAYANNTFVNGKINIRCDTTSNYSPATMSTSGVITFTLTLPNSITSSLKLIITGNHTNGTEETIDLLYAKLEVGSIATQFEPPLTAIELPKCQRYFIKLSPYGQSGGVNFFGNGFARYTTEVRVVIPLPTQLRTYPVIVTNDNFFVLDNTSNTNYTPSDFFVQCTNTSGVLLRMTVANVTAGRGMSLYGTTVSSYISFDAEIY